MNKAYQVEIREIKAEDTWKIRHQVMWPDQDIDYVILPKDQTGRHFGVFIREKLIAVISLFIENRKAQFRKFATLQKYQGRGYGTQLLQFVFDQAIDYQVDIIWCNARVDKTCFYQKFGMQQTNQAFVKGGIDYVIMEKQISLE